MNNYTCNINIAVFLTHFKSRQEKLNMHCFKAFEDIFEEFIIWHGIYLGLFGTKHKCC